MIKARIIWGCPASGKSTYVTEHRGDNDITYDYDVLMQALGGTNPHEHNKAIGKHLSMIRTTLIKNMAEEKNLDTFWMIITWVDDELKEKFKDYKDVEYIVMETTEEECIKRVESNSDRQASKEEQIKVIKEWFIKYNKLLKERKKEYMKL